MRRVPLSHTCCCAGLYKPRPPVAIQSSSPLLHRKHLSVAAQGLDAFVLKLGVESIASADGWDVVAFGFRQT